MKINKVWTVLGFLLLIIGVIDIIFYWPESGEFWVFLIKKIFYILVGSFLIWDYFIKPIRTNTRGAD